MRVRSGRGSGRGRSRRPTCRPHPQQVRRLDVAVEDPLGVGVRQRLGRLPAEFGGRAEAIPVKPDVGFGSLFQSLDHSHQVLPLDRPHCGEPDAIFRPVAKTGTMPGWCRPAAAWASTWNRRTCRGSIAAAFWSTFKGARRPSEIFPPRRRPPSRPAPPGGGCGNSSGCRGRRPAAPGRSVR